MDPPSENLSIRNRTTLVPLVKILRDEGQDLSKFPDLEDYTVFAVQYRYEAYDSEDDIDRDEAIEKTRTFLAHVQGILDSTA
jgi:hypothetical protein